MPANHVYTKAPAFADLNADGILDIFTGNWSIGPLENSLSLKAAKNYLFISSDSGYSKQTMKGLDGETLSTLFSDIDNDGDIDLVVGNDFIVPDYYYFNRDGILVLSTKKDGLVENISATTMSLISADLDNDLKFEIFHGQIDNSDFRLKGDIERPCELIKNVEERKICEKIFDYQRRLTRAASIKSVLSCNDSTKLDCLLLKLFYDKYRFKDMTIQMEDYFAKTDSKLLFMATFDKSQINPISKAMNKANAYPVKRSGPVLLEREANIFFDITAQSGIEKVGWMWNSKFADLDSDGLQDLFITCSFLMHNKRDRCSLYMNKGKLKFEDFTEASGLSSYAPTSTYTYLDYDLDGDIDILTAPSIGPVAMHQNQSTENNNIAFELNDNKGNRKGVNAKITIFYGDGQKQIKEILASGGFPSFDNPVMYFGLGSNKKINKIEVDWVTGETTIIKQTLKAGYLYKINRL
jgi:hypothetical protein